MYGIIGAGGANRSGVIHNSYGILLATDSAAARDGIAHLEGICLNYPTGGAEAGSTLGRRLGKIKTSSTDQYGCKYWDTGSICTLL